MNISPNHLPLLVGGFVLFLGILLISFHALNRYAG